MKKIVITLVAISLGVVANAASYSWTANSGRLFDGQGSSSANRYTGTGYLFNAATVTQASIITAFTSDAGVTATLGSALSQNAFAAGRANASEYFTGPDADFTAYFVVLGTDASGNDAIYISDEITASYSGVGAGEVVFGEQNDYSSVGFKNALAGFGSAGWYTAVPEPTSGLLLLLGMAGLALKRKRA